MKPRWATRVFATTRATLRYFEQDGYEYLEGRWKGWDEFGFPCASAWISMRRQKVNPLPAIAPPTVNSTTVQLPKVNAPQKADTMAVKTTPPPNPRAIPIEPPPNPRAIPIEPLPLRAKNVVGHAQGANQRQLPIEQPPIDREAVGRQPRGWR